MRERHDMSEQKLHEALLELKAKLGELDLNDAEARRKLQSLIRDIQNSIDQPGNAERHHTLLQDVRDALEHFEVEHPTLTAVLNDLMMTLSNMGI
jgi:seryl-tRNA synthetase